MRPRPPALHLVTAALVTVASAGLLPATPEGSAPPSPQAPAAPPAVAQTAGVTASRVAVDLVVRDKKGRLVRDLKPGELELLEDGAPQEVLSLRLVDTIGGARAVPGAPAAATRAGRRDGHRRATPAGRARRSSSRFSSTASRPRPAAPRTTPRSSGCSETRRRTRATSASSASTRRLETLQSFTDDPQAAMEARRPRPRLEHADAASPRSDRERLRGRCARDRFAVSARRARRRAAARPRAGPRGAEPGLEVGAAWTPSAARGRGRGTASRRSGSCASRSGMLEAARGARARPAGPRPRVNAILALVNGLKTAPGRKAVVFFSEGLVLPPRVASTLQPSSPRPTAAGVTFYAADAAGLRTVSGADETPARAGRDRRRDAGGPGRRHAARVLTKAIERNEDMLRLRPDERALDAGPRDRRLPGQPTPTRSRRSLRAAEEDLASYYLLEYAPSNELWDGRFRRIEVRVQAARRARPGAAGLLRGADGHADAAARLRGAGARRARDGTARERPRLPRDGGPGARPAGRERGAGAGRGGRRRADDRRRATRRSATSRTSRCSCSCATRRAASCAS